MRFPLSTGQAAETIGTTEPKLSEEVRRGRVNPRPTVFAGRRLWEPHHLLQAAQNLGLLTDELRESVTQQVEACARDLRNGPTDDEDRSPEVSS